MGAQTHGRAESVIAIAQLRMHWTLDDNLAEIEAAMRRSRAEGAQICAFAELALTGFHRDIVTEGVPDKVGPALDHVCALAGELGLAVAIGAPSFGTGGARFNSHLLIDERGVLQARVHKVGYGRKLRPSRFDDDGTRRAS